MTHYEPNDPEFYYTQKVVAAALLLAVLLLAACNHPEPKQPAQLAAQTTRPMSGVATASSLPTTPTQTPGRVPPTATITLPPPSPTATSTPLITPPPVQAVLITNGSRALPYVALTFDLCQKPEYPAGFDQGIVDALVKAEAPATFFVGGDWARTHPDETRLLAANPLFELGNHSWTHPDLIDLDVTQINEQIGLAQDIITQITGRTPRLFRLPAGLYNNQVLRLIAQAGLYTIQWDVVTADPVPDNSAENINRIVRDKVQNGSIIIMHANGRGWHTAEALPGMIEYLRQAGYTLVTVSQLLGLEPLPGETP